MSKKINLAAALHEASGKRQVQTATAVPISKDDLSTILKSKPPSRFGKKIIAGHFDPAVIRQLKILAMDQDSSIQGMLSESLNDLFEKYNMKSIA